MLRHCVQSWTRDPREDLSTPRLTFFFLKAEPLAASLPAFLLLESAISTSAVVPSALCRYDEFEISLPPTCCGLGPAMQG